MHGNDDSLDAQRELPYQQVIAVTGQRIVLTHAHYTDRAQELEARKNDVWGPKLERRVAFGRSAGASIVVFGHTHVPMTYQHDEVLLVNPGAIAPPDYVRRQEIQTVALLFIRDDGAPFVAHINLASPERVFVPQIDWQAGFAKAHSQFCSSIMAADLAAVWRDLEGYARALDPAARAALRAVSRRAAEPYWSGTRATMTRADLLGEVQRADDLPADVRAELAALLA